MKKLVSIYLASICVLLASAQCLAANTCFVTEFSAAPPPMYPVAQQPPLAEQTIAITSSSTQSSAFQPNTVFVRITCDASVSIKFGTNPTATVTTALLPSGLIEYYLVPAGQSYKLAVIANS
jgi:hypothetical protein